MNGFIISSIISGLIFIASLIWLIVVNTRTTVNDYSFINDSVVIIIGIITLIISIITLLIGLNK